MFPTQWPAGDLPSPGDPVPQGLLHYHARIAGPMISFPMGAFWVYPGTSKDKRFRRVEMQKAKLYLGFTVPNEETPHPASAMTFRRW